ncbi:hypothetical protein OIV61_25980 [Burkholderia pseudomallei]|nr:hypothetical protein [Burkholderia pseudomallei]MCW0159887.1 hypothetical protein [Burkholderia pseudomallei]MCW0172174.1 hypothetical protein [Burkholderia pseudomallei]
METWPRAVRFAMRRAPPADEWVEWVEWVELNESRRPAGSTDRTAPARTHSIIVADGNACAAHPDRRTRARTGRHVLRACAPSGKRMRTRGIPGRDCNRREREPPVEGP